jgi:hypothetical protein
MIMIKYFPAEVLIPRVWRAKMQADSRVSTVAAPIEHQKKGLEQ